MIPLKTAFKSSVVQKLLTAVTGLLLIGFVIMHLLGNLLILKPDHGVAFNAYAKGLENLGALLEFAEVGLVVFFGVHILNGIRLKFNHRAARPIDYRAWKSKGSPSRSNSSSNYMIVSGTVLAVFLVAHIIHFKLGPDIAQGYVTQAHGMVVRDLHRLVVESFRTGWIAALYSLVMIFLGMHLRHGFWSAFQSMGAINPRLSPVISAVGVILAIVITIGFLGIPFLIYFDPMGVYR